MAEGSKTPLLRSIRLENILSYRGHREPFELGPLNVLIGTNASGKSNLIEVLALLAETPRDVLKPIREGGGVDDWLWKGGEPQPIAAVEVVCSYPPSSKPLLYRLAFSSVGGRFDLIDEVICDRASDDSQRRVYYDYQSGAPVLYVQSSSKDHSRRSPKRLELENFRPNQSILSQRKDADLYPELTWIGDSLSRLACFREWSFGRYAPPRLPQKVDLPEDFLLEDASNLGLVLNNLLNEPKTKQILLQHLRSLYEEVEDIHIKIQGGTVQVFFRESGLTSPIPATRLSDGTLRFLCLLTILCHPDPLPVICLEEPEMGLHPDAIATIGELLIEASERTQLIVTTHSDVLVSALSETPESVIVTERDENGTQLRRLDRNELAEWLDRYRLGELWQMGELGGVRW